MTRPEWTSIAAGAGAAGVFALVGPLYGGLVVVLAVPVVFLTLSRMLFGSETGPVWGTLLIAAGVAWFMLLAVSPFARNALDAHPESWLWLLLVGAVPLAAGASMMVRARRLSLASRDIGRR